MDLLINTNSPRMAALNNLNRYERNVCFLSHAFSFSDIYNYFFLTKHTELEVLGPTPTEDFLIKLQTGNRDKKVICYFYQIFIDMELIKGRWERNEYGNAREHVVTTSNT